jgi:hypothetical protein
MYFKDFPKFAYDFEIAGKTKVLLLTDITRNVRFRKEILGKIELYDEYDIQDGETPEIIAEKIYGNANYHWVIMLVNERYDYIADFPMSYPQLTKYVQDKYGVGNEYETHHYVNEKGYIVDQYYVGKSAVSNLDYEERLNEQKRRIKLVSPQLIDRVMKQFKDIL